MIFKIKQGQHSSNQHLYKIANYFNLSNKMAFAVTFTDSCAYDLHSIDQLDINKLFGFSNGKHHDNSARFGWSYINNKIQLWAYYYNNGQRKNKLLTILELNKPYQLYLRVVETKYQFAVADTTRALALLRVPKGTDKNFGYRLWPYFGGNSVSPHDMEIHMTRIY